VLIFFVELRFVDPSLCQAIADMQDALRSVDPTIVMDQSCAPDNLHITLNEIRLRGVADVHRAAAVLEAALPPPLASTSLELAGARILGRRVLYAKLVENEASSRLLELFGLLKNVLCTAEFDHLERGSFVPHVTVCKAQGSGPFSQQISLALRERGFDRMQFGAQPFVELCFCCKRRNDEMLPPVIRRLRVG